MKIKARQVDKNEIVPCTGAIVDVDLGAHKLTANAVVLNNNSVVAAPRQISWNDTEKTFDMGLTTDVTLQVGAEELIRVRNNTASNILNGQPVYIIGYDINDEPLVALAGAKLASNGTYVVGVATELIPIGGNGFATARGKIHGLNTLGYTSGQEIYLGETPGTFTANTTAFELSSHKNSIGYIGIVDAVNGSVYITIRNEQTILSLSETERNILSGNSSSTGVYDYTGMTIATPTSFTVPPLKGIIVDNTGIYALAPDVTNVVFAGGTYPVTNILTDIATYVLISRTGIISQQVTYPTPEQRRDYIFLGKIVHTNKSTILTINNTSDYDTAPFSALRDMFAPISIINEGIVTYPDGANLSFNKTAGSLYGMGINWVVNNKSPNKVTLSASLPVTFGYYTQTAVFNASTTLITPGFYDVGGVRTAISSSGDGGGNRSTNHRVYQFTTGNIIVQYGQALYSSLTNAVAGTQTESFVKFPAIPGGAVLIGIISVRRTATVLNDPAYAIFTPVSIFGEATGGTAGLATTTLQQAYNNSTTPEIVTNAILGAVTIQNGTGNADNVTNLLEGRDALGNVTSSVKADGSVSSVNSTVSGIAGISGSIVTHDTNGKLLDSGVLVTSLMPLTTLPSHNTVAIGTYAILPSDKVCYANFANTILLPAAPLADEDHTIVHANGGIVTIDGNGKMINWFGLNSTLTIEPDTAVHLHFNATNNKWYVI